MTTRRRRTAEEVLVLTRRMLDAMYTAEPTVHQQHCAEICRPRVVHRAARIDGLDFH